MAIQAIEDTLVQPLKEILSPITVAQMGSEIVSRIAGESTETQNLREHLTKRRNDLRTGSEMCRVFMG